MPRINFKKHKKGNIQRALLFNNKLTEAGLYSKDVAKELKIMPSAITKYAYGYLGKKSRIEKWAQERFGNDFINELNQFLL